MRIDSRTSDAVALAVRSDCPIFIYDSILERERLRMKEEEMEREEETEEETKKERGLPRSVSSMSLEEALEQAIKDENYELAARIRDKMKQKK